MSSIPLPALHVQAPQQEDLLGQAGKVVNLQSMLQQRQMQSMQLQQAQLDLDDQKKIRQAFMDAQGDMDKTIDLSAKAGVKPQTLLALKNSALEQKQKLATLSKDQLENQKGLIDLTEKSAERVMNAKPEDRAGVYANERLGLVKAGLPAEQIPEQYPGDEFVKLHATAANASKKQIAEVEKAQSEAQTSAAEMQIKQAQAKAMQGGGAAVGTGLDVQEANAWLRKNPGKDLADYQKYKATLVPNFNFNLQTGGAGNGQVPKDASGNELSGDKLLKSFGAKGNVIKAIAEGRQSPPSSFALKSPYWQDVYNKLYQYDPDFNEQRAQLRKAYTTGAQSKEINAINTTLGHIGVLGDAISALDNGDIRVLNKLANRLGLETGSTPVAVFKTIVHRVGPEVVKAYAGTGGGVEERASSEKDFDPNLPTQTLKANVGVTAQLLRSKIASLENQWDQNKSPNMPAFRDRFLMKEAQAVEDQWSGQGVKKEAAEQPIYAVNPKTKERIMSTDGGQTWQPAK